MMQGEWGKVNGILKRPVTKRKHIVVEKAGRQVSKCMKSHQTSVTHSLPNIIIHRKSPNFHTEHPPGGNTLTAQKIVAIAQTHVSSPRNRPTFIIHIM